MSFFWQNPVARFLVSLVVGTAIAFLLHRYWTKLIPRRLLLAVARRSPGRLTSAIENAEAEVGSLKDGGIETLMGKYGDEETLEAARFLVTDLNRHHPKILLHGQEVCDITTVICREMGISGAEAARIRVAALFHDAGWMGLQSSFLETHDPYDESIEEEMVRHPNFGQVILSPIGIWLAKAGSVISQHHEHFDGNGYPRMIRGSAIALPARIVAVADAFAAMTSTTTGGAAMSAGAALAAIEAEAGKKFDPKVVRALLVAATRRPVVAIVGGTALAGAGRALASSWASVSVGAAVAASSVIGLSLVPNPAPPKELQLSEPATTTSTTSTTIVYEAPAKSSTTRATTTRQPSTTKAPATTAKPVTTEKPTTSATTTPTTPAPTVTRPFVTTAKPTTTAAPTTKRPTTTAANKPPSANNDTASVTAGQSVSIPVLQNDTDPEGALRSSTLAITSYPTKGTVTVSGSNVIYAARTNSSGDDVFAYRVCDDRGACDDAAVTVSIIATPVNAVNDQISVPGSGTVAARIQVLSNDTGPIDSSTLAVTSQPSIGRAAVSSGVVTYSSTASIGVGTQVTFTYQVCSAAGDCSSATVTVRGT